MLTPIFGNIEFIKQLFNVCGPCVKIDHTISGYQKHQVTIESLGVGQKAVLEQIIQNIMFSLTTNAPIKCIQVIGHADIDFSVPPLERDRVEAEVSVDRGNAALQLISDEINKRIKIQGGSTRTSQILAHSTGVGSTERIFAIPTSEDQRNANRRVVIKLSRCLLPDLPKVEPDTFQKRIDRLERLLKTKGLPNAPEHRKKRAPCILNVLRNDNGGDNFVDGRATSVNGVGPFPVISNFGRPCFLCEFLGNYDTVKNPLPEAEVSKFIGQVIPIIKSTGFLPSQTDDHVLLLLNLIIERIDMGINQVDLYISQNSAFVNPLTKEGYSGDAVRIRLQKMFRDHLNDNGNIYSCYK